ncbi:hypothetical protein AX16_003380 [Volvariella volvacea WC 439]|nr:hypothetical protein AX16_003380 [Volvariella volvacea WC 439]
MGYSALSRRRKGPGRSSDLSHVPPIASYLKSNDMRHNSAMNHQTEPPTTHYNSPSNDNVATNIPSPPLQAHFYPPTLNSQAADPSQQWPLNPECGINQSPHRYLHEPSRDAYFLPDSYVDNRNGTIFNTAGGTTFNISSGPAPKSILEILLPYICSQAMFDGDDRSDAPKCHPETRKSIFADIEPWAISIDSETGALWLVGPVGTGKSAIMRKVCVDLDKQDRRLIIGSFFFWRNDNGRNSVKAFVPTIAYRLSMVMPEVGEWISRAIAQNPSILQYPLEAQWNALIIQPLCQAFNSAATKPTQRALIAIDGLDECDPPSAQQEVLRLLPTLIKHGLHQYIAFLVASRPESQIKTAISSLMRDHPTLFRSPHLVLSETEESREDMRLILTTSFNSIRQHCHLIIGDRSWPPEGTIDRIVDLAKGQFIYVLTIVRWLAGGHPIGRLNAIFGSVNNQQAEAFTSLDLLYGLILKAACSSEAGNLVLPCLFLVTNLKAGAKGLVELELELERVRARVLELERPLERMREREKLRERLGELEQLRKQLQKRLQIPEIKQTWGQQDLMVQRLRELEQAQELVREQKRTQEQLWEWEWERVKKQVPELKLEWELEQVQKQVQVRMWELQREQALLQEHAWTLQDLSRFFQRDCGYIRLILQPLHSVLRIPDSDSDLIQIYHKSFSEYLHNSSRSGIYYAGDKEVICLLLTRAFELDYDHLGFDQEFDGRDRKLATVWLSLPLKDVGITSDLAHALAQTRAVDWLCGYTEQMKQRQSLDYGTPEGYRNFCEWLESSSLSMREKARILCNFPPKLFGKWYEKGPRDWVWGIQTKQSRLRNSG